MKVRPSVKPICDKCKVIKRKGKALDNLALITYFFDRRSDFHLNTS